jgi:hypothetical protein
VRFGGIEVVRRDEAWLYRRREGVADWECDWERICHRGLVWITQWLRRCVWDGLVMCSSRAG